MEKQATELAEVPEANSAKVPNHGRFRAGDPRINRRGRPRSAAVAARRALAAQLISGKIMRLFVPGADLRTCLTRWDHPKIINLPSDYKIRDIALDRPRRQIVLTISSERFEVVQAGDPIPEFEPVYDGLRWRKKDS
jgi:hypothetical protein